MLRMLRNRTFDKGGRIFDCLGESPPEIYVDGPLSEMLNPINGQEMR